MEILNIDNCTRQCTCGCLFKYDKRDVNTDVEQYWAGLIKGGWLTREYRYVVCPVCAKHIVLK